MFLTNLKLGLKDLSRMKLWLLTLTYCLATLCYLLAAGLGSWQQELILGGGLKVTRFSLTPVSFDTGVTTDLLNQLDDILADHAFSYAVLDNQDGNSTFSAIRQDATIYLVAGDAALAGIKPAEGLAGQAYYNSAYTTTAQNLRLRDLTFTFTPLPAALDLSTLYGLSQTDDQAEVYIFLAPQQLAVLLDKQPYDLLAQFLTNTRILSQDQPRVQAFTDLGSQTLFDIRPLANDETLFLVYYLAPFILLSCLLLALTLVVLTRARLADMLRTLTLHYLHGGDRLALNLRFLPVPLTVCLLTLLLLSLLRLWSYPRLPLITSLVLLGFVLLAELMVFVALRQKSFINSIRAEG
ncbi:MAG: hypothetical protein PHP39_02835 [Oscillospiraceae bacterium]|nr:hypothetical protein [Oscillospiraceae bacterium]